MIGDTDLEAGVARRSASFLLATEIPYRSPVGTRPMRAETTMREYIATGL